MERIFEAEDCELASAAGGRVLRLRAAERFCLLENWSGPLPPARLSHLVVDLQGTDGCQLQSSEGRFNGRISGYQLLTHAPVLLEPLSRPFQLRPFSRAVALILLQLLRLPGGGSLLRAWHERRR